MGCFQGSQYGWGFNVKHIDLTVMNWHIMVQVPADLRHGSHL
jgi:hypothetical protein